ncbi:pentapeptide repeat-containing protein [Actinomadura soli]|uniref:Pentapeptide repeat-containing protein n=1 Tax=Actinomadura soli TaxID=2508997 RepID=A0A5C4J030_9ACTN|nr:pentapeptide repeat-containing protein [Actinomadura soli]TMQ89801.1 pentapeptide repeat-containing protein [Actinomadura soli]
MSEDEERPKYRPAKDAHMALGMWSIRRTLALAFTIAAILLVAAWFFLHWLLGSPPDDKPRPLDTAAQLELLKLVFALVAGVGALVALITAYRRQRVDEAAGERAERIQAYAEHDATERRVTDLYSQAVEQLGHDKAAVRLGGLYSLERLAQDHPQHRQTVADVVCAYLRMPFQPPRPAADRQETEGSPRSGSDSDAAWQELQVRLAAQRLLHRHLATTPSGQEHPATYWDGMLIDLTGALLVDFDFTRCRPAVVSFANAQFSGGAGFEEAQFSGSAGFEGAQFSETAKFRDVHFGETARFDEARFSGDVTFTNAQFNGSTGFDKAQFGSTAWFRGARFGGTAWFRDAQFSGTARFDGIRFSETVRFDEARFGGGVRFDGAQFGGGVRFGGVHFRDTAWFRGAQFSKTAWFRGARFGGTAWFRDAQFSGTAWFGGARFGGTARFDGALLHHEPDFASATARHPDSNHVWPDPWRTQRDPSGEAHLVRAS